MNVLLTSAGRRNYLVDYFKEAVSPYGGKVFAVNSHEYAPALYCADGYSVAPPIHSDQYIPFLLNYCQTHEIKLIVPLLDNDLPVLAQSKPMFDQLGVYVLAPDLELAKLANDKYKTFLFLKDHGFPTVSVFKSFEDFKKSDFSDSPEFPLIIKPRWGMGSMSVYEAEDALDLDFFYQRARKEILGSFLKHESAQDIGNEVIIMPKISGEEYMLDVINDLNGNHLVTVVNKKLLRKGGETEAAETVNHPQLEALGAKISSLIKHPLVMDIDVIMNGEKPYILEFNPRFSGGYPFSHQAGINLPKVLIQWFLGNSVDKEALLSPKIGTKSMKGIVMLPARNQNQIDDSINGQIVPKTILCPTSVG
jgi:carbamoyl-phosphate synthase large subunit